MDRTQLLFHDFSLDEEYRVIDKLRFILTGLLIVISVGRIISLIKRR